jgi:flagellar hook-associated protein 1
MAGLFGSLEIGKRALINQRMAMDTIGHNIANANTEGYTRQKVRFTATTPRIDRNHLVGTGVEVMQFERMRDNLIDKEVRFMKSNLGYSEQKLQLMSNIEGMFPEPSDYGLQSYMSNFFSELRNVSNNPLDLTIRNTFVQSAVTLTKGFNRTADNMIQMGEDMRISVSERVRDINNLLSEIDGVNQKVAIQHSSGLQANDLRDKRDQMLDELSKYMNIQKEEQSSGAVLVYSNGYHLVGEDTHMSLIHENVFDGQNETSVVKIKENNQELKNKFW